MFSPSREYSGIRDNGEGKGTEVSAYRAGPERSGGVGVGFDTESTHISLCKEEPESSMGVGGGRERKGEERYFHVGLGQRYEGEIHGDVSRYQFLQVGQRKIEV